MAAPCPLLLLALTALCCLAAARADDKSNDIVFGTCRTNDQLLHSETVRRDSQLLRKVTAYVSYPEAGKNGGVISCVRLQPLKTGDNLGSAKVETGGPGERKVSVKVKSARGHSVAWNVLVYGEH